MPAGRKKKDMRQKIEVYIARVLIIILFVSPLLIPVYLAIRLFQLNMCG